MSVFLIGYRGSGKTTIGRKLADRLWQPFVDLDEIVVKAAGKSIRDIFAQDGEKAFRDFETDALREAVKLNEHVVALGGGAVEREENRALLARAGHRVIYLRAEPEELHRRIHADPQTAEARPALTALGGGLEEIKAVLERREPIYRGVMTAELDVTHLTPEEAVVYIVRLL
jgi:shikimate kinase